MARAFRLLGLHPGPTIDFYGLAALANTTVAAARQLLETLFRAHLVQETALGRSGMHDLLRAYAAEQAAADPEDDRRVALTRLLDYYTYTALLAAERAYPQDRDYLPRFPVPHAPHPDLADRAEAVAWLEAERLNLLAAADYAASHGWPIRTSQMSRALARHLLTRAYYHDASTVHTHALLAACGLGDRSGEGHALASLAEVDLMVDRYEPALDRYGQALALTREPGDRVGAARALVGLGEVHRRVGRYEPALDRYQEALAVARAVGFRTGERAALVGLGEVCTMMGRYQQATDHLQQALAIAGEVGDRAGERAALISLGEIHRLAGQHE